MALSLSAFYVVDVALSSGLPSVQVGSRVLNFDSLNPPRLGRYAALIWNPTLPYTVSLPPRKEILPSALGGRTLYLYMGNALLACGQNTGGRRPLGVEVRLVAPNQNLLGGTGWDFFPRGLVSVQIETAENQGWQLTYVEYD